MKILKTHLDGAYLIEPDPIEDQRGFFARTFCCAEFESNGLSPLLAQCSISFNRKKGTLRGMHYQKPPHEESKLIRCTMGRIYDVILDLRPVSLTFGKWYSTELSAENRRGLYVPEGVAHGFQTLQDNTEVLYCISKMYHESSAAGVRWNDPKFAIKWPLPVSIISEKDRKYPDIV